MSAEVFVGLTAHGKNNRSAVNNVLVAEPDLRVRIPVECYRLNVKIFGRLL